MRTILFLIAWLALLSAEVAVADCGALVPFRTKEGRVAYSSATSLVKESRTQEAIRHYRRALSLEPDNWCLVMDLVDALKQVGDIKGAISEYREWLAAHPRQPDLYENLVTLLNNDRHDPVSAIEACREWLQREDTNIARRTHGAVLLQEGQLEEAITELTKAVARLDGPAENRLLGNALEKKGRYAEAAARYRRAIDKYPEGLDAHYDLGDLLRKTGDIDGALTEYRAAISLHSKSALLHDWLGDLYAEIGRIDAAISEYSAAIVLEPWDEYGHYKLAALLASRGDASGATRERSGAMQACMDRSDVKTQLDCHVALASDAWEVHKDKKMAETEWNVALQAKPSDAAFHVSYAAMLADAGDIDHAILQYREALRYGGSTDATSHFALGKLLLKKGSGREAFEEFSRAYELDPTNATFRLRYEEAKQARH